MQGFKQSITKNVDAIYFYFPEFLPSKFTKVENGQKGGKIINIRNWSLNFHEHTCAIEGRIELHVFVDHLASAAVHIPHLDRVAVGVVRAARQTRLVRLRKREHVRRLAVQRALALARLHVPNINRAVHRST